MAHIDMQELSELLKKANNWLLQDPDKITSSYLQNLIIKAEALDAVSIDALKDLFSSYISFGTAGLRGELGPGPKNINRVVVSQATAAFARYLTEMQSQQKLPDPPSIIIGYDGRHNSKIFAEDAASIASGFGLKTYLFDKEIPTPVLAYSLKKLDLYGAIMITASHNPAQDNGYKVFLGKKDGGSQIITPSDKIIAGYITEIYDNTPINELPRSTNYEFIGDNLIDQYISDTADEILKITNTDFTGVQSIDIQNMQNLPCVQYCYTAMHGVGWNITQKLYGALNILPNCVVKNQLMPDPDFSTVSFPNPEEKGALDMAIAEADKNNINLILAHDPDADRLGVAIKENNSWRRLTGNEIGLLLADIIATRYMSSGKTLACSLVSSPLLKNIAHHNGLNYEATLTGFKYVSRAQNLIYGYEEALGYLITPNLLKDKDGISAGALLLIYLSILQKDSLSIHDALNNINQKYGYALSDQLSLRFDSKDKPKEIMRHIRQTKLDKIDIHKITNIYDYKNHSTPDDIISYELENGIRIIVRPSGTEPKLKIYFDAVFKEKPTETAEEVFAHLKSWWQTQLTA